MGKASQTEIWDANWEQRLSSIDPGRILGSPFTAEAYGALSSLVEGDRDRRILEAGCGTGRLSCLLARDLPGAIVCGFDISQSSITISRALKEYLGAGNLCFHLGDLFSIPYPDSAFDVVFNEGVIEHYGLDGTPSYVDALAEMKRAARPGGKVIAAVPNWFNLPHTVYKWLLNLKGRSFVYGYEKSFRPSELKKVFRGLGLVDLEVRGFAPAHGFQRLSNRGLLRLAGVTVEKMRSISDLFRKGFFSDIFGFEIFVKGTKPLNAKASR